MTSGVGWGENQITDMTIKEVYSLHLIENNI